MHPQSGAGGNNTMTKGRIIGLFLLLLWAAVSCVVVSPDDEQDPVAVGDGLPSFSVVMNDGSTIGNEYLLGKVSLICFFNTECPDCRMELPEIQGIYEDGSCALLLISRAQQKDSIQKYWQENGLTMPFSAQETDRLFKRFASSVIPRIYICDRKGIVRYMHDDKSLPTKELLSREIEDIK